MGKTTRKNTELPPCCDDVNSNVRSRIGYHHHRTAKSPLATHGANQRSKCPDLSPTYPASHAGRENLCETNAIRDNRKEAEALTAERTELGGGGGGVSAGGAEPEVVPPVRLRDRARLAVTAACHPSSSERQQWRRRWI